MATISDLITDAFIEAGILAAGESMQAGDAQFALRKLNRLLDSWSADGFVINGPYKENIDLLAGYGQPSGFGTSIGVGKTIDTQVPIRILNADLIIDEIRYPVQSITTQDYDSITNPYLTGRPTKIYLQNNSNDAKIYLWPIPEQAYSMEMSSDKPMGGYSLTDDLGFTGFPLAPSFERMFVSNLAIDLCPSYGVEPSQLLLKAAQDSYSACARLCHQPVKMTSDLATNDGYSDPNAIYSGGT